MSLAQVSGDDRVFSVPFSDKANRNIKVSFFSIPNLQKDNLFREGVMNTTIMLTYYYDDNAADYPGTTAILLI